jgi:hypothetical protein
LSFYTVGICFWVVSFLLFFGGMVFMHSSPIVSVALIITSIANFILGGLFIIYAELMK